MSSPRRGRHREVLLSTDPHGTDPHPGDPYAGDPYAEDVVAGREPGTAFLRGQGAAVLAVAVGGALGSVARYSLGVAVPTVGGAFPTGTFLVNVAGCLLMGVLVVLVTEVREAHPLVRPFLGVGVLGGFTTFSTFSYDGLRLLQDRHLVLGGAYLVGTVVATVLAAALGLTVTRRLAVRR